MMSVVVKLGSLHCGRKLFGINIRKQMLARMVYSVESWKEVEVKFISWKVKFEQEKVEKNPKNHQNQSIMGV